MKHPRWSLDPDPNGLARRRWMAESAPFPHWRSSMGGGKLLGTSSYMDAPHPLGKQSGFKKMRRLAPVLALLHWWPSPCTTRCRRNTSTYGVVAKFVRNEMVLCSSFPQWTQCLMVGDPPVSCLISTHGKCHVLPDMAGLRSN